MTDQQLEEISERIAKKYEAKEDKHNCGPWYRSAIQDFIKETEAFHERDLAQARAALDARWLPIESAPKDGTHVLLWCLWDDEIRIPCEVMSGWWTTHQQWSCCLNRKKYDIPVPTHWMPLPQPPASSAEEAQG